MPEITLDSLMKQKTGSSSSSELVSTATHDIALAPKEELSQEDIKRVEEIKNNINLMDTQQMTQYGVGAQRNISQFSSNILNNIKAKDSGEVGEMMTDLMLKVKDVDVESLGRDGGFLSKIPIFGNALKSFEKFVARYETLEVQIDKIQNQLDIQRMEMLKDITMFDKLYEKNLEYFNDLKVYIAAGEEKIEETRRDVIPALRQEAAASGDPMKAQVVADFEATVNRFEKKVHDLKLSKTMAIQTAPQIKLIQNNDKLLVEKIQTTILNTIPLWKSQIVIAIGLYKQEGALKLQKEVSDTTNKLLTKNSEMLKQNTIEVAKESERGIIDMETLKKVNADLIETIDETIKIQKDGRAQRQKAEQELVQIEDQLKEKLLQARE